MSSFEGRVVAVTGAGSGIGAATAALLGERGARVVVLDRAWPQGRAVQSEGMAETLDVTDEASVARAFDAVRQRFGRLDGLATCAGIVDTHPFADLDAAAFRKVYDVNVVGTFTCMKAASTLMESGGRIVTISSIAGIRGGGLLGTAAYSASKGAVLALTKSAARALGGKGIAVNCVAPGPTETAMTDAAFADASRKTMVSGLTALGRTASPTEIAEAIVWLLSPASSFVSGATLVVDGGIVML